MKIIKCSENDNIGAGLTKSNQRNTVINNKKIRLYRHLRCKWNEFNIHTDHIQQRTFRCDLKCFSTVIMTD